MPKSSQRMLSVVYHVVRPIRDSAYPGFKGMELEDFLAQVDLLRDRLTPVSSTQLARACRSEGELPARGFFLTFDDGLRDHYELVLPELRKRSMSAAFFAVTEPIFEGRIPTVEKQRFLQYSARDYREFLERFTESLLDLDPDIDREQVEPSAANMARHRDYLAHHTFYSDAERHFRFVRDRLLPPESFTRVIDRLFARQFPDPREYARKTFLSPAMLAGMHEAGMLVGGHTHSHVMLERCDDAEQAREIGRGLELLGQSTGKAPWCFAYPFGSLSDSTPGILRDMGVRLAFTTRSGLSAEDWLRIDRIDCTALPTRRDDARHATLEQMVAQL